MWDLGCIIVLVLVVGTGLGTAAYEWWTEDRQ